MSAHDVLWAKPSIARPGAETMVLRVPNQSKYRAYEQLEDQSFEPVSNAFSLDRAAEVAEKILRGDAVALGDARTAVLVAAAVLALVGERPKPPREIEVPDMAKPGELG